MINWKVRFKNEDFWLTFIPAVLLLIQAIAKLIGFEVDFGEVGNNLKEIVNDLFVVLVILGVINDPTTDGMSDSKRAMSYNKPWNDNLNG